MSKIKIMIVDDHPVVREGLKQLLGIKEDIEVIAEASSGLECLEIIEEIQPDIIFMDLKMPGISGIETTRIICEKFPHMNVLVLTIYNEERHVSEAIRCGAKGYVLKTASSEELYSAINHVIKNQAFLDPAITSKVIKYLQKDRPISELKKESNLTKREFEVLRYLVDGLKDREIGKEMHISAHTVRSHIKNIFKKLYVTSKAQAVAEAINKGLISKQ